MASLDQLPQEVQDELRSRGIDDLSVFEEQANASEAFFAFVEEQIAALQQETMAVNARIEYLLSVLPQYAEGEQ